MDQVTHPARYLGQQPRTRPDAAAAPRKPHTKGLHAARPDGITAALSHGRTSGAGRRPRFVLSGDNPLQGEGGTARPAQYAIALDRPPGPQRRTGSALRAAERPSFPFARRSRTVGWAHEGSREAEEGPEEGRAEVAEGEAQRKARQEARQHLYRLGG